MRKIIFRGKHYLTNEWVYGDLSCISSSKNYVFINTKNKGTIQVKPETVGQFTGLYDINNKEIYEGDLLSGRNSPLIVKYSAPEYSFQYKNEDYNHPITHWVVGWGDIYDPKIIGNIYDNPELIKENK